MEKWFAALIALLLGSAAIFIVTGFLLRENVMLGTYDRDGSEEGNFAVIASLIVMIVSGVSAAAGILAGWKKGIFGVGKVERKEAVVVTEAY